MKDITVENFNYSNVKEWISGYTHKQKVEFAVYCAELVIDLYIGTGDAPKKAIQAAKDWILNPSEEDKKKCKDASVAASAAYAAYATAGTASASAAYAAASVAASAAASAADAAASAASVASVASVAASAADAAAKNSMKKKVVNYLLGKVEQSKQEVEQPKHTKVEYVKVTDSIFDLKELFYGGCLYVQLLGDSGEYRVIEEESTLIDEMRDDNVYRKVTTEITERDLVIERACSELEKVHGERRQYVVESLYDAGLLKSIEVKG